MRPRVDKPGVLPDSGKTIAVKNDNRQVGGEHEFREASSL